MSDFVPSASAYHRKLTVPVYDGTAATRTKWRMMMMISAGTKRYGFTPETMAGTSTVDEEYFSLTAYIVESLTPEMVEKVSGHIDDTDPRNGLALWKWLNLESSTESKAQTTNIKIGARQRNPPRSLTEGFGDFGTRISGAAINAGNHGSLLFAPNAITPVKAAAEQELMAQLIEGVSDDTMRKELMQLAGPTVAKMLDKLVLSQEWQTQHADSTAAFAASPYGKAVTDGTKRVKLTAEQTAAQKRVPCRNFAAGHCFHGDKCRYSHAANTGATDVSTEHCRAYANGKCTRANGKCKRIHDPSKLKVKPAAAAADASQPAAGVAATGTYLGQPPPGLTKVHTADFYEQHAAALRAEAASDAAAQRAAVQALYGNGPPGYAHLDPHARLATLSSYAAYRGIPPPAPPPGSPPRQTANRFAAIDPDPDPEPMPPLLPPSAPSSDGEVDFEEDLLASDELYRQQQLDNQISARLNSGAGPSELALSFAQIVCNTSVRNLHALQYFLTSAFLTSASINRSPHLWICDTGATRHMTPHEHDFATKKIIYGPFNPRYQP